VAVLARLTLLALAVSLLPGYSLIRAGDNPDDPPLRWSRGFSVPIHTHTDGYSELALGTVRDAMESALASWHNDDATLRFVRDPNGRDGEPSTMDGVNLVSFVEDRLPREIDGNSVLAWTSPLSVACTGVLIEADVTFNAVTTTWSTSLGSRRADIQTVALHEFGHLLGLDHSGNDSAVMFPSIVQRVRRDLHRDDLNGLLALYNTDLGGDCSRDRDCRGGEVCQFGVQSDEEFETRCAPVLGNARPGGRCNENGNPCTNGCANGLCFGDGLCSAICRADADCPAGYTCLEQDVGDGQLIPFCIDIDLCEGDLDGCPAGDACVVTTHPSEDRAMFVCTDAGNRAIGADCDEHEQCDGALCLGVCSRFCDAADQCPAPYTCQEIEIPLDRGLTDQVSLCDFPQIDCVRNRDCPEALTCAFTLLNGRIGGRCAEIDGAPAGEPCQTAEACRSGVCLGEGVCSGVCRNDGDCPETLTCDRARINGESIPACVVPNAVPSDAGVVLPPPPDDAGLAPPVGGGDDPPPPPMGGNPPAGGAPPVGGADAPPLGGGVVTPPLRDASVGDGGPGPGVIIRHGGSSAQQGLCSARPGAPPLPAWPAGLAVVLGWGLRRRRR
jgi:hypothetical protein